MVSWVLFFSDVVRVWVADESVCRFVGDDVGYVTASKEGLVERNELHAT